MYFSGRYFTQTARIPAQGHCKAIMVLKGNITQQHLTKNLKEASNTTLKEAMSSHLINTMPKNTNDTADAYYLHSAAI